RPDSNDTAPGSLADHFSHPERFEPKWENIPIRGRELVNQRHHRTGETIHRIRLRHSVAGYADHDKGTPQSLDHEWRNESAAISAHIHDQRFFADLRKVRFGELIETGSTHVRDMDITHFASGFL